MKKYIWLKQFGVKEFENDVIPKLPADNSKDMTFLGTYDDIFELSKFDISNLNNCEYRLPYDLIEINDELINLIKEFDPKFSIDTRGWYPNKITAYMPELYIDSYGDDHRFSAKLKWESYVKTPIKGQSTGVELVRCQFDDNEIVHYLWIYNLYSNGSVSEFILTKSLESAKRLIDSMKIMEWRM